jgi:Flp pilus assembly pilin Flp
LGWIPLAFFIVAVNGEFLAQARITATVERPLLLAIIAVGFVAVVALVLLNQITQGWVTAFGRLVRLIAFYLVYGWFSVCSMRIMAGSSMMAAMFGALTFIGEHLDKVLVYLGLVFLFFLGVLLAATGLGALSPKPVGVLIPAFLGRFLPALFSPVMSAIFLKVTYFKDPTVLRPLK